MSYKQVPIHQWYAPALAELGTGTFSTMYNCVHVPQRVRWRVSFEQVRHRRVADVHSLTY